MFTVQKKGILFLSDFNGRIGGITVDKGVVVGSNPFIGKNNSSDPDVSEDRFITLQNAIVTFVSTILGKGNERPQIRIWASEIIPQLTPEVQTLILGNVLRSPDGQVSSYGSWDGVTRDELIRVLPTYI